MAERTHRRERDENTFGTEGQARILKFPQRLAHSSESASHNSPETDDPPIQDAAFEIKPSIPPMTEHELREKYNISIFGPLVGPRQAKFLSCLRLAGGDGNWQTIKQQLKEQYNITLSDQDSIKMKESFTKKGWVHFKDDIINLTDQGWDFIKDFEAHVGPLEAVEPPEKLTENTTYKIIDVIVAAIHERHGPDIEPAGKWMRPSTSKSSVLEWLEEELSGISYDSLVRRIHDMRNRAIPFLNVKTIKPNDVIVNLCLTEAAVEHREKVREKVRERDKLIDDEEAWEVSQMTQTCIELATALGQWDVARSLTQQQDHESLFEMSFSRFKKHRGYITSLLEKLRREYVLAFRKK